MRPATRITSRRGGILFEILLSIALFAGAASVVLGVTGSAVNRQDVTLRQQQAHDIARSLMASLEAGLTTIADIREGLPRALGSFDQWGEQMNERVERGLAGWVTSINTQRSAYRGLSVVEITVTERRPGSSGMASAVEAGNGDGLVSITIRQLVRLREEDPEAWEVDELIEDLPESRGGAEQ